MGDGRFDWKGLSEDDFNRMAELLIMRKHKDDVGLAIEVIDGRGGDEGIDIRLVVKATGQIVHIYQLKYFPEGFSSKYVGRRSQIKESFRKAKEHGAGRWTLVAPTKGTIPERKFVTQLSSGLKIRTDFLGISTLDDLLAANPDVQTWVMRNSLRDALAIAGLESSLPTTADEAAQRYESAADRSSAVSAYWKPTFSNLNGINVHGLEPRRPDAAEKEPLSFQLSTNFGEGDAQIHEAFRSTLGYGARGQLKIPARNISKLESFGPEWFAKVWEDVEVVIGPQGGIVNIPISLNSYDEKGKRLASHAGRVTYAMQGSIGQTMELTFPGGVSFTLTLPLDRTKDAAGRLEVDLVGHDAGSAMKAIKFTDALAAAKSLGLTVRDGGEMKLNYRGELADPVPVDMRQVIDDLETLERLLSVSFEIRDVQLSTLDRIWIRVARLIAEGHRVLIPQLDGFTATLSGTLDDTLAGMLVEPHRIHVSSDVFPVEILGIEIPMPDVTIEFDSAEIADSKEVLERLNAGTAAGLKVPFVPVSGLQASIHVPSSSDVVGRPELSQWGVVGAKEHTLLSSMKKAEGKSKSDSKA